MDLLKKICFNAMVTLCYIAATLTLILVIKVLADVILNGLTH